VTPFKKRLLEKNYGRLRNVLIAQAKLHSDPHHRSVDGMIERDTGGSK
jgi:hypothetical protein